MELKFGLLADYASVAERGKLVIAGEFDQINAQTAPVTWPLMFLVARFEASITEGSKHRLRLDTRDADGRQVIPAIEGDIGFVPRGPGRPLRGQIIMRLEGLQFPRAGDYSFNLLVDGRELGTVGLFLTTSADATQKG